MLGGAGHEVIAAPVGGPRYALQCEIVGLRSARCEYHFFRPGPDQLRDLFTGGLDGCFRPATGNVLRMASRTRGSVGVVA